MTAGMVIIGAGECGARAAFALRESGFQGSITLIGDEPHTPYERPPLSKAAIVLEGSAAKLIADPARYADADINLVLSTQAMAIDREARRVRVGDGRAISYERLLIATGCSARRLPSVPEGPAIAYLRTLNDAEAIKARLVPGARLVVIGGGFIGLELAASARKRGAKVTVVEAQPRILMRGVPAVIAAVVHELHVANGVEIVCGNGIASIVADGQSAKVTLSSSRSIEADLVLIGIGAVPNVALATAAGLATDNGIAVDATLATSDPLIFAAGDCCSFPLDTHGGRRVRLESWRNAQEHGTLAARNMLDAKERHSAVPWFWSDQYDHSLQIAGLADPGMRTVRRDLDDGAFILFQLAENGKLQGAGGIGPGNSVARDIRLAEMLIAKGAAPDPAMLQDLDVSLKALLRG